MNHHHDYFQHLYSKAVAIYATNYDIFRLVQIRILPHEFHSGELRHYCTG